MYNIHQGGRELNASDLSTHGEGIGLHSVATLVHNVGEDLALYHHGKMGKAVISGLSSR